MCGFLSGGDEGSASRRFDRIEQSPIAVFAHEVRNPLNAIQIQLQNVVSDLNASDPKSATTLRRVLEHVEKLDEYLRRLLRYMTLPPPDRGPVDLHRLAADMRDFFGPQFAAAKVRLALRKRGRTHARAVVDEGQIKQALLNLLLNALEASPAGGRVTVVVDSMGATVRIAVEDEGPGVAPEDRGRLFEPFFSRRGGGGLGLALVRRIVDQHGGRVVFEPRRPRGSRFVIELPSAAGRQR